jgi:hypothetical protein
MTANATTTGSRLLSLARNVNNWLFGDSTRKTRPGPQKVRPAVEQLESRETPGNLSMQQALAALRAPVIVNQALRTAAQYGPAAAAQNLIYQTSPSGGIRDLMVNNGYKNIANMPAATSGGYYQIINSPLVQQGLKTMNKTDYRDAVFTFGPGFTPQVYNAVNNLINQMPGTRGSMIDLVNTTKFAGLPQLVPTMQTITNPGAAFINQAHLPASTTYGDLADGFMRNLMPFAGNLFPGQSSVPPIIQALGGPVH